MNAAAKLKREVQRMLSERMTLLFIALTAAGTVWFCLHSSGETASNAYILEPAKNSAVLGALLFTLLTLAQFYREDKNNTGSIVMACTDPVFYQLRRTMALICTAVATTLIVTLFTLPYALIKTGAYFQADAFAAAWYLIFLGVLVFAVLLSSALYMLFRRVDVAFIVMVGLILLSELLHYQYEHATNPMNPSYLLFWVQTNADGFSDMAGNRFQINLILWNRLFCLLASLGLWFLGLCCQRRYGRGIFGSFISNARRAWMPICLIAAIALSYGSYVNEPYFDQSVSKNSEVNYSSGTGIVASKGQKSEKNTNLLLSEKCVQAEIDTQSCSLAGKTTYTLRNTTGGAQILLVSLNSGYTISGVQVNGTPAQAVRDETEEGGNATWKIELPGAPEYTILIDYTGKVQNDGSSLGRIPIYGISGDYISLPSTGVSPSTDTSISDDCSFSGTLSLDSRFEPVFKSAEASKGETANGKTQWKFRADPGNDRSGLYAAFYHTTTFEAGGLNVEVKYFAKQDAAIADMDSIGIMKAAIDYFTNVYGPLPYQNHLTILERPANFSGGGGGAFGNTSAMAETSFAVTGYLPDELDNPDSGGGIDVLVHELAHQWWGLATYPDMDDASYWSAEGITCYSTYCFMKDYFGEKYANEHFINEWQSGWKSYQNAFYIQHPEFFKKLSDSDQSHMLELLNNIGLYDMMPLKLLKAEAALGGTEAFQGKLKQLYQSYLGNDITYDNFLSVTGLTGEVLNLA